MIFGKRHRVSRFSGAVKARLPAAVGTHIATREILTGFELDLWGWI